jgi:hypothetical protein
MSAFGRKADTDQSAVVFRRPLLKHPFFEQSISGAGSFCSKSEPAVDVRQQLKIEQLRPIALSRPLLECNYGKCRNNNGRQCASIPFSLS